MIKYNFGKKRLNFNVFIGLEKNYLSSSRFTAAKRGDFDLIEAISNESEYKKSFSSPYRDDYLISTNLRSKNNSSRFWGLGFKYRPNKKLSRNFINLSLKYSTFQNYINYKQIENPEPITENDIRRDLIFGLGYIDDELELRYFQIAFGYSYTMYRVVEERKMWQF